MTAVDLGNETSTAAPLIEEAPPSRNLTMALFAAAAAVSWYTGFRMPNSWAQTLQSISLQDGFYRRFLIGTILQPFAALFGYSHWFYVGVSFLVIAALFGMLGVLIARTRLTERKVLIIAWLLAPTGTFLFNEAGYLDQFLYLGLFAAIWFWRRGRVVAASVLMTLAPFVHEVAILTVLPVFAFVVLRDVRFISAIRTLIAPMLAAAIVLVIPAASSGATEHAAERLKNADWKPRVDLYSVYHRSFTASWHLYSPIEILEFAVPFLVLAVATFLVFVRFDRQQQNLSHRLMAACAIAAPALLFVAGWDWNRWTFFVLCGFFIVTWLWLDDAEVAARVGATRQPRPEQWLTLAVAALLMTHLDILYFGWTPPRPLGWQAFDKFLHDIHSGTLFQTPFN